MMIRIRRSHSLAILLGFSMMLSGQEIETSLEGQFLAWLTVNPEVATQIGGRYIPAFSASYLMGETWLADIEASVNLFGFSDFRTPENQYGESDLSPYRLWGRLSGTSWEARIGLQKINFGPARILRPLMWFDSIDPRDPLQLTDGVYALLGRYYFPNNGNIWLWGLYGNEDPRGFDPFFSAADRPEVGGRLQLPVLTGEVAFSAHYRTIDLQNDFLLNLLAGGDRIDEVRYGFDGKWDIEVGLWIEGALIDRDFIIGDLRYQKMVTLGMDYTFAIGNGLGVTAEHLMTEFSGKAFSWGKSSGIPMTEEAEDVLGAQSLSALIINYPLGLIDNLSLITYVSWKTEDHYRFLTWERKYDSWSIYFMAFWNPDMEFRSSVSPADGTGSSLFGSNGTNLFAGKGIQIMFVYNH